METTTIFGTIIGVLMSMFTTAFSVIRILRGEIDNKTGHLHTRLDKVKEDYVRRDDLNAHLNRLEKSLEKLQEEQKVLNERIAALLSILAAQNVQHP